MKRIFAINVSVLQNVLTDCPDVGDSVRGQREGDVYEVDSVSSGGGGSWLKLINNDLTFFRKADIVPRTRQC